MIYLLFNENQQAFHFDYPGEGKPLNDWRRLAAMPVEKALKFIKTLNTREYMETSDIQIKLNQFRYGN